MTHSPWEPGHRAAFSVILLILAWSLGSGSQEAEAAGDPHPTVATFSIVACDTVAGEWGVAVASRFLAVGSVVPWARAGVGAIASQADANTRFGPEALALLEKGMSATEVLSLLLTGDAERQSRQVGLVDARGGSATFTGTRCFPEAGGLEGPGFAIQGNSLAGDRVIRAMGEAFQNSGGRPLAERLLAALEQGEREGGDARGKQAAALLVVKEGGGYGGWNDRYVDLRVDDHADPVSELRRLYGLHARTFLPAVHARLGDAALARGDRRAADREFSRTIAFYREAIEALPEDPQPRNALAWFFVSHRVNLTEAMSLARQAYELDPESWEVLDTVAEIHFARGQLKEAYEVANRALALDPGNPNLQKQAERFRRALDEHGD